MVGSKRAFLFDLALVVLFAGLYVLEIAVQPGPLGMPGWSAMAISCPAMATLLLRRRWPWIPLVVTVTAAIVLTLLSDLGGPTSFPILISVYSVCRKSGVVGSTAAAALAMVWPFFYTFPEPSPLAAFASIVYAGVDVGMVVAWGYAARVAAARAAQLERTVALLDAARDQLAVEAAASERARIAREFHDIVSHNLSVVALRAGVARALVDRDPGHARETLRELEQTSSAALSELRTLLSALHHDTSSGEIAELPGRQPMPRLDRIEDLVRSLREAGVSWRLERRGTVRELNSGLELTAFRVVQEAVTNVLKHAGPGYARVLLEYGAAALRIEITNHVTASPRRHLGGGAGSGHGLIGLRERVALVGGTFTAHPVQGGFHLEAVLPCPENSDLV
ncbi:sensor histidine kinase [Saccharopolyspora taberi]|uniref:histidine kinase n=1 Tax=Saccharopolyspora taberi TaxID=60895 RepID=A0ABN3VFZ9_9PSEU